MCQIAFVNMGTLDYQANVLRFSAIKHSDIICLSVYLMNDYNAKSMALTSAWHVNKNKLWWTDRVANKPYSIQRWTLITRVRYRYAETAFASFLRKPPHPHPMGNPEVWYEVCPLSSLSLKACYYQLISKRVHITFCCPALVRTVRVWVCVLQFCLPQTQCFCAHWSSHQWNICALDFHIIMLNSTPRS